MSDEPSIPDSGTCVWSPAVDSWYQDVRDELGLRSTADQTLLEVAAIAMQRAKRTAQPDTADLRLILDALAALRVRRTRRWWRRR